MNRNTIVLILFVLASLTQLYVPVKMIMDREKVIDKGELVKIRTAPIDPTDPFRGKYINLQFENDMINVPTHEDWTSGDKAYVFLNKDNNDFVTVQSVSKTKPKSDALHITATVNYVSANEVQLRYPFNRYYMEEAKAGPAETIYNELQGDSTQLTYALVHVLNGESVLRDVMVNGTSIVDMARERIK